MCAEVRAGDGGGAVFITVTPLTTYVTSRTVHLGGAPLPSFIVGNTGEPGLILEYEGEDTGTAGVRTRHSVAAGAGRLCTDVSTQVEVIIMGAGSITRFPLLNTDIAA